jgi:hypothetical protein
MNEMNVVIHSYPPVTVGLPLKKNYIKNITIKFTGGNGGERNCRPVERCGTPGMGVNLWGESPLYVNPVKMLNILAKVLADGKGVAARHRLKEARVQSYEPTNRNGIQGPVSG